ncbi:MAG: DUF5672 family protein, partial [Candidatus Paceibacterota bacterium]
SSILPSPGFRIAINVPPNVPLTLEISGNLLVGDKAFVYCECRSPKENLNTRIIPRTHLFFPDTKNTNTTFKIDFSSNFDKIYLGVLFFNKDIDYHLIINKFYLSVIKNSTNLVVGDSATVGDVSVVEGAKTTVGGQLFTIDRNLVDFGLVLEVLNQVRIVRNQNFHSAVIVEPRLDPLLIKIIDHFLQVLPTQSWNFVVYCGNLNVAMLREVYSNNNRIQLIHLPINNLTRESYSRLLLYPEFYMSIPAEHFLIFQMDTCLNHKSIGFLEKLLNYDYVGAPWKKKIKSLTEPTTINHVGNGGLSLRKKSSMIKVCQMIQNTPKYQYLWKHHEDQVICSVLHSRLINGVIRMPDPDIAKKFAVESIFYPDPVGIHQAWRWLSPADYLKLRERIPVIDQLFKVIK